jgi:hypothetical protein
MSGRPGRSRVIVVAAADDGAVWFDGVADLSELIERVLPELVTSDETWALLGDLREAQRAFNDVVASRGDADGLPDSPEHRAAGAALEQAREALAAEMPGLVTLIEHPAEARAIAAGIDEALTVRRAA